MLCACEQREGSSTEVTPDGKNGMCAKGGYQGMFYFFFIFFKSRKLELGWECVEGRYQTPLHETCIRPIV